MLGHSTLFPFLSKISVIGSKISPTSIDKFSRFDCTVNSCEFIQIEDNRSELSINLKVKFFIIDF